MFSAFFSGYESAILSIRMSRIRELVRKKVHNAKTVAKLKEHQHVTLITLLIGNNIVNISASALATKMTFDLLAKYGIQEGYGIAIATGIMTFLLLVFGEITPKTLAIKRAEKVALLGAKIFSIISIILAPFRFFFEKISALLLLLFGVNMKESTYYTAGELKEFVEMSHEEGAIKETEKEMIHNVLDFNNIDVRDVMTPLSKVAAIDAKRTLKEVVSFVVKDNFSRIPVYENHIEEIIGVVYIKDVMPYIERGETDIQVKQIMRKIVHVPSIKKIHTLFHYFKSKKEHIAVVVNEYGNTLGIVTMEDILEELVGEIQDESDDEDENNVKRIDNNTVVVPGTTNIEDVNELLAVSIDDHHGVFQTIAGYIFYHLGKIPKKGHTLTINDLTLTIIDSDHKKINTVKIEKRGTSYKRDFINSTNRLLKK
jgi:CBS domain containing-hemolysin-like protein